MGYPLHAVEGFGAPFLIVHEQIVLIPESGRQETRNEAAKLIFLLSGACRHRVVGLPPDGSAGEPGEVALNAGDVMVIPHRCRQWYVAPRPGEACRVQALRLAFDPALVPPLPLTPPVAETVEHSETNLAAFARRYFTRFRHLPGALDAVPALRETLAPLRAEAQGRPPGYRLRVHGLCAGLVTLVARHAAEAEGGAAVPMDGADVRRQAHLVALARDYVLLHLDRPLSLARIAADAGVSGEHLARVFRQSTGQTVFEYVRRMRLERAKTLLAGSGHNVGEVARLSGFESPAVFSRTFRRAVGVSPSEYRRRVSGEVG